MSILVEFSHGLRNIYGIMHSFAGSSRQMRILLSYKFDIGVTAYSFRDRESLQMVKDIPLSRLHLATEAPDLEIPPSSEIAQRYLVNARPLPMSKEIHHFEWGKMVKGRNESCAIERVALVVAGLQGQSLADVAFCTTQNSKKYFWGGN